MLRFLLATCAVVGVANAIYCNSCDDFVSCGSPITQHCPRHSGCYTMTTNFGQTVISKGCAHDCQNLPPREGAHCLLCKGLDFCNSPQTEIGQGTIMRQQPPPPQIGGGAVPDNGYHIGHGVRPRSATQASVGLLMALPVIRGFVF
ncbi:UPAR/Ly6 domain-containing protein [Caenorhabditis elegans]|uniref:UPAR/Ly6 domain-containing protein n=1 Tax=Caenorhabditis elegans TaxID=6239 RepID=O17890_CAEEL|nr:UPAR/Ly6 domain-containing protein [Caenorhabditis elegans]CAB05900.1 UPAR/Ly6 domain-containing protein [Caenorhabditis elegans]|eukprot:NP_502750.1 Uncharacterized protein CELE_F55B11.4 [Caenorhabditis elegans]